MIYTCTITSITDQNTPAEDLLAEPDINPEGPTCIAIKRNKQLCNLAYNY